MTATFRSRQGTLLFRTFRTLRRPAHACEGANMVIERIFAVRARSATPVAAADHAKN